MAEEPAATTRLQLERILAALRARDWIGIAIELGVVTLGVLLAFQIEQWGQERRQLREERQFLERMWRETGEAIAESEWAMTMHGRFRQEFVQGFDALDDSAELIRLAATPNVGCRVTTIPAVGFNTTTFQELSASGRLNIIHDESIRAALREVVAAQANGDESRDHLQPLAVENQRALDPYFVLGLDGAGNRICRMDWPRIAENRVARNAVMRSARLHTILWLQRAWVRDRLTIAHNGIACALGKSDCKSKVVTILRSRPRTDHIPPEARQSVERSAMRYSGN